ncbi:hypothetical protein AAHZ94_33940, partial [Streptomyces sp. HSW2009]|uniref:hypothetical protein n=1 Tax=Streptomyces sp. HSW2009 TaxID=3142890 RepID=UPI0032EB8001
MLVHPAVCGALRVRFGAQVAYLEGVRVGDLDHLVQAWGGAGRPPPPAGGGGAGRGGARGPGPLRTPRPGPSSRAIRAVLAC